MEAGNIPIHVIAHCGADGGIRPLRFQYEDAGHRVYTVRVQEVADIRKIEFTGIEALMFLCRTKEADGDRMYELKYTIATHRWVLFRRIY